MADDDEQTVALELDQHEQGDDGSPDALSERRGKWVREEVEDAAVRRDEDREQQLREEDDLLHEERVERARQDERELEEIRERHTVTAETETTRAMRLAEVDEASRDLRRRDAGIERLHGRIERARGDHLLDEAAARPDEPGASATAAAGRAHHRAAADADRRAVNDERDADRYDARARDRRSEAARQPGQPPAGEAVRNPPSEPPTARKFDRKRGKKQRKTQPGELGDIGLGD
ncbi:MULTISPECIES: hypothetical protein [unclassified Kribbella]|uniref:hypothetical protein n=1 Tax=unclassified Kribbella TaxID=2644121 RepID=UPI0030170D52